MPANLRIARSRARPAEYADALTEAVARLSAAKSAATDAEEYYTHCQNEVLTIMTSANIKSSTVPWDDARLKVSVVQSETMEFNEHSLRKALTAAVFDKLCTLKLDRTKLEIAVAEGRVDPVLVASNTTIKKRKPWIRLTPVKGSET